MLSELSVEDCVVQSLEERRRDLANQVGDVRSRLVHLRLLEDEGVARLYQRGDVFEEEVSRTVASLIVVLHAFLYLFMLLLSPDILSRPQHFRRLLLLFLRNHQIFSLIILI